MTSRTELKYKPGDRLMNHAGVEAFLIHDALAGGMGEVYLGLDLEMNLPFALKTFQQRYLNKTDRKKLIDHFKHEANIWINLGKHPNIVDCYSMLLLDNQPYLKLEWVIGDQKYGTDLRSWLKKGSLDVRQALDFTIDICRGLIHAQKICPGIVHRDIKPDNILISQKHVAKITDFGLAKIGQTLDITEYGDEAERVRNFSSMGGTPAYMAPEQWLNREPDPRTDIYAVGCTLYEMLIGHSIYQASNLRALRLLHLESAIPTLEGQVEIDNPEQLTYILSKCLAKQPESRFESAEILLAEISKLYETVFGQHPHDVMTSNELTVNEHIDRGLTFIRLRQPKDGLIEFEKAIQLDPKQADIYINRGVYYLNVVHDFDKAIKDLQEAIRLAPANALARLNLGEAYKQQHNLNQALENLSEAIRLGEENQKFPYLAQTYNKRGTIYEELGKFDSAIADYREAIRIDPSFSLPHYNIGDVLTKMGNYQQALSFFERAAKLGHQGAAMRVKALTKIGILIKDDSSNADFIEATVGLNTDLLFLMTSVQTLHTLESLREAVEMNSNLLNSSFIDYYENCAPTFELLDVDSNANQKVAWLKQIALEKRIEEEDSSLARINALNMAIRSSTNLIENYLERGHIFLELKQNEKAISDFNEAILLNPSLPEAYYSRGSILMIEGRNEEARAVFCEAIDRNPDFVYAYGGRGQALYHLGFLEESIADFSKAIELRPTLAEAYGSRGLAYSDLGQHQRAMSDYNEAIRLESVQAQVYCNRANVYISLGRYEEALADITRAIRISPDEALFYANRGVILDRLGRLDEALGDYQKAVRLNPKDHQNYFGLGNIYSEQKQYEEALKCYNEAFELTQDDAKIFLNRGSVFMSLSRYDEALADINRAIELSPDYARAYLNRGVICSKIGQTEQALSDYIHATQIDPNNATAYTNIGSLFVSVGRLDEAEPYFEKAAQLGHHEGVRGLDFVKRWKDVANDPGKLNFSHLLEISSRIRKPADIEQLFVELPFLKQPALIAALEQSVSEMPFHLQVIANQQIGLMKQYLRHLDRDNIKELLEMVRSLQLEGRHDEALTILDHVYEIDPNSAPAYCARGLSFAALGHYQDSILYFSQAILLDPTFNNAYYYRGLAWANFGKNQWAIDDFDKAIQIDPAFKEAYYERGATYMDLGQYQEGLKDADKVISLDPNFSLAWSLKGLILVAINNKPEGLECLRIASQLGDPQAGKIIEELEEK